MILSVFPGIDLFGLAVQEVFSDDCVVRGPDLIFGSLHDIRSFHAPPGVFWFVFGGPPCQPFSALARLNKRCGVKHGNLIPEFERIIRETQPACFLMENVKDAPIPEVEGYQTFSLLINNRWVGGEQTRLRRFSFGTRDGRRLEPEWVALENVYRCPSVTASGTRWVPVKLGGSDKVKSTYQGRKGGRPEGAVNTRYFREAVIAQGLPADFDLPGFTVREKIRAVGNGVPLPLGRAIAQAVKRAMEVE